LLPPDSFLPRPHNIKEKAEDLFNSTGFNALSKVIKIGQGDQNHRHAIRVLLLALPTTKALKDIIVFRFILIERV
jgi:uncharacterized membrane protein